LPGTPPPAPRLAAPDSPEGAGEIWRGGSGCGFNSTWLAGLCMPLLCPGLDVRLPSNVPEFPCPCALWAVPDMSIPGCGAPLSSPLCPPELTGVSPPPPSEARAGIAMGKFTP